MTGKKVAMKSKIGRGPKIEDDFESTSEYFSMSVFGQNI